ncbi:CPBP family intramembrane glutamic endopeptidase [Shouchella shacheensis]|uniref:CPBP family intramembrane glutamic endopeptidase n=1 Tax=Shouchella shacheensis TaxID=1649580 RepID=UPI0007404115|nr:type II CAAX endopeptidase family protein [Shouchella shacheensis]
MTLRYVFILLTYAIVQLGLPFLIVPVLLMLGFNTEAELLGITTVFSFTVGLIVILILLKPERELGGGLRRTKSSAGMTIVWSIVGVFLVFFAQYLAAIIELLLGIDPGSENTQQLVEYARAFPLIILAIAVVGPILEEIVFRKVLFGWVYVRTNFWVAALFSSLIFAVVHWDFTHILIYTAMGFSFAFLYVISGRLIVPIIAHVALNSFVVLTQVVFYDDIQRFLEEYDQVVQLILGV